MSATTPLVSIVIPVFNKWAYTHRCLTSVLGTPDDVHFEIIVVDNASSDETQVGLRRMSPAFGIRVIRNETNLGFARGCNQGAAISRGAFLVFLNNDTEAYPGWLKHLVKIPLRRKQVAVTGAKLLFPDGTIQHAGVGIFGGQLWPILPLHLGYRQPAALYTAVQAVECVTGACLLIRKSVFDKLGGFDDGFVNGYEDVDLCLKVRETGHQILLVPQSVLTHFESTSEGRFNAENQNVERLNARWYGRFNRFHHVTHGIPLTATETRHRTPVTVVVLSCNALETCVPVLESIVTNLGPNDQLVLVDKSSRPVTSKILRTFAKTPRSFDIGVEQTCPKATYDDAARRA